MTQHAKEVRSSMLNMRIDPKLHFLAAIAARHKSQSLSNFVEDAIIQALKPKAMLGDEPKPGCEPKQKLKQEEHLFCEELWSEDEGTRLYMLMMTHPECASPSQQTTWAVISRHAARDGKKLTLTTFTQYFHRS